MVIAKFVVNQKKYVNVNGVGKMNNYTTEFMYLALGYAIGSISTYLIILWHRYQKKGDKR
jgi:hypothetical protein